jgi:hypothetical protein
VRGEELVVEIGTDDVVLGAEQLQPHEQRLRAGEGEEDEGGDHVALADVLV